MATRVFPTYDLSRFRILLVEDNHYVRGVLEDVLRHLTVGEVRTAENGLLALEILKESNVGPEMGGSNIDLVLSDMVMTPIDGLLLLKWIRESPESPNRFMPFIMISGASDDEDVKKARDLGVNEFLAKPFSATSVSQRLLEVIDRPRQFVATGEYFGPDRQRRSDDSPDNDRRVLTEKSATVVYTSKRVVRPSNPSDVYLFRMRNTLKEKAGGVGATGVGQLPLNLLEEADETLQRKSLDFHGWALKYLTRLSAQCRSSLQIAENRRAQNFGEINILAHELRGQGGTFGYPLITTVGKMLYDISRPGCAMDDTTIKIIKAHIDTMQAVFRDKVTGDGGETGRELIHSLNQAIERHLHGDDG